MTERWRTPPISGGPTSVAESVPLSDPAQREAWREADRAARPARLAALRRALAAEGVDGYLAVRPENARYLTGFALRDGEEKVAGTSGHVLVTGDRVLIFADPRYEEQARREAPESELVAAYHDLPARWPAVVAGLRRVAVDQAAPWGLVAALAAAAPRVELVPAPPWVEGLRSRKEPAEVERIAAAAAVVDRALGGWLPEVRTGMSEVELAWRLEWRIRSGGADGLAFNLAVLAGPNAALPHGHPSGRPLAWGDILLVDVGAQVDGYRSDMTRTFFVGEPTPEAMDLAEVVLRGQEAALAGLAAAAAAGERPTGRQVDAWARDVIAAAGWGGAFVHGLGHGIGLATHEAPTVSFRGADEPLPAPTVVSLEPGIYLPGRLGIRIEDLVLFDPGSARLELLTRFPRRPVVLPVSVAGARDAGRMARRTPHRSRARDGARLRREPTRHQEFDRR